MNLEVKISIPTKPKKIQHLSDISLKTALIKAKTEENVMTSNCIKILNHDDELSSPSAEVNQISNTRKNKKDKDNTKKTKSGVVNNNNDGDSNISQSHLGPETLCVGVNTNPFGETLAGVVLGKLKEGSGKGEEDREVVLKEKYNINKLKPRHEQVLQR